jgi:hypothetical protein
LLSLDCTAGGSGFFLLAQFFGFFSASWLSSLSHFILFAPHFLLLIGTIKLRRIVLKIIASFFKL